MNTLSKFHVDINKIRKVIGRKGNKLMPQKYETSFYLHINFSLTLNARKLQFNFKRVFFETTFSNFAEVLLHAADEQSL